MEKHEDTDQISLLTEFYKDEERPHSSSRPSSSDFELRSDNVRPNWARTLFDHLQHIFWQALCILLSIIASFIPSFTPKFGSSAKEAGSERRLSPTAYLDGLRGIACFVVYLHHFVLNWYPDLRNAFGASPGDHNFLRLPIIRIIFEGQSAVATFFVISGYAISYRAMSKMHNGDTTGLLETLSSSTFRRCLRIYLPCTANTFICMLLQYNGFFTQDPLRWNTVPPRFDTFSAQFWDWWGNQKIFTYPFLTVENGVYSPPYNGHLWTIPLEIRGSFVVYGTVLAIAKFTPFWRMAFLIVWDCYLYYMARWDLFLFVGGVLLANLDVPRHVAAKKPAQETSPEGEGLLPTSVSMCQMTVDDSEENMLWPRLTAVGRGNSAQVWKAVNPISRVLRAVIPYVLFMLSMYTLSFPHVPYMEWARQFVPESFDHIPGMFGGRDQGIRIIGSMLLAFSLSLSAASTTSPSTNGFFASFRNINLQYLFTNSVSQYLGRISFGFYLMHGPVLFTMGTKLFLVPAWATLMADRDLGTYGKKFALAALVNTVTIVWVGDIFMRVVDERTVRWAAWVAKFMSRKAKQVTSGS